MFERDIEAYLVRRVKELGGEIRKVKWIGRKGAPDRFVMWPDAPAVWVELKATNVKAKPYQIREHGRMRRMGQRVEVIDSMGGVDELLSL